METNFLEKTLCPEQFIFITPEIKTRISFIYDAFICLIGIDCMCVFKTFFNKRLFPFLYRFLFLNEPGAMAP